MVEMVMGKVAVLEEMLEDDNECVYIKLSRTTNPRTSMGMRTSSD